MITFNLSRTVINFNLLSYFLEIQGEPLEITLSLWCFRFNQECEGEYIEWILPYKVVVLAHIQENTFFIS